MFANFNIFYETPIDWLDMDLSPQLIDYLITTYQKDKQNIYQKKV